MKARDIAPGLFFRSDSVYSKAKLKAAIRGANSVEEAVDIAHNEFDDYDSKAQQIHSDIREFFEGSDSGVVRGSANKLRVAMAEGRAALASAALQIRDWTPSGEINKPSAKRVLLRSFKAALEAYTDASKMPGAPDLRSKIMEAKAGIQKWSR